MKLSYQTIQRLFEDWVDHQKHIHDWCGEYGEPGYSTREGDTPMVWLGDWWCTCHDPFPGRTEEQANDPRPLHGISDHYPRLFAQLESQGIEMEWYDEWVVDHEYGKCYRVSGDSYMWQPVTRYTNYGDLLTPDDDIETWIEDIKNGRGVLPSRVWSSGDLIAAGFTLWEDRLEAGWHPGQDADPETIMKAIREVHGDSVDIVFQLSENSQFYSVFAAYIRPVKEDDDA